MTSKNEMNVPLVCHKCGSKDVALNTDIPYPKIIAEFFSNCGEAIGINETLWDMFYESISSPDSCTDYHANAERAFLYKRLTELLLVLEPQKKITKNDLPEN
jgi:RNAse (barnase) inhibitor barstar